MVPEVADPVDPDAAVLQAMTGLPVAAPVAPRPTSPVPDAEANHRTEPRVELRVFAVNRFQKERCPVSADNFDELPFFSRR